MCERKRIPLFKKKLPKSCVSKWITSTKVVHCCERQSLTMSRTKILTKIIKLWAEQKQDIHAAQKKKYEEKFLEILAVQKYKIWAEQKCKL